MLMKPGEIIDEHHKYFNKELENTVIDQVYNNCSENTLAGISSILVIKKNA